MEYESGTVLEKEQFADRIFRIRLHHPPIASKVKAGQFLLLLMDERSERIPFAISDWSGDGWIEFVFDAVGYTTKRLSHIRPGYKFLNVAGPLGNPVEVGGGLDVGMVAEGIGISEAYAVARAFREAGSGVRSILGVKTASRLFYLDKMGSVSDEVFLCSEDGTVGEKGSVTDLLERVIKSRKPDFVYMVGSVGMMKVVSELTSEYGIRTMASLRPLMLCGIGICGTCRVKVGGKIKLVCMDGPAFDAHQVDFDELIKRMGMFREEEVHILSASEAIR